jgi:hypothetical protein
MPVKPAGEPQDAREDDQTRPLRPHVLDERHQSRSGAEGVSELQALGAAAEVPFWPKQL